MGLILLRDDGLSEDLEYTPSSATGKRCDLGEISFLSRSPILIYRRRHSDSMVFETVFSVWGGVVESNAHRGQAGNRNKSSEPRVRKT